MGKKKFIDKKKSATFQLYARDSSVPNSSDEPGSDRVFVRVDDNPYSFDDANGGGGDGDADDSIFADAVEDDDDAGSGGDATGGGGFKLETPATGLPEAVRKEILELGFPDDGYNYLKHMKEIKKSGGGAAYFNNPQFKVEQLPLDVKVYNASKVPVPEVKEMFDEKKIYTVAAKTYTVRAPKAIDPDIAALLDDDDDLSRFGSDAEDLEEDFILQANYTEGDNVTSNQDLDVDQRCEALQNDLGMINLHGNATNFGGDHEVSNHSLKYEDDSHYEKPRGRRFLDDQFDMLESQEYGSDSDDDYYDGPIEDDGDEALEDKLYRVLKDRGDVDEIEFDGKYRAPTDILRSDEMSHDAEIQDTAVQVIRRTKEYGKNFEMDDYEGKNLVYVEESSDESEKWDCETIITTYSNFDNHPGKIEVPEKPRRKKLSQTVADALNAGTPMISLGGKQKLPLDYLPNRGKGATEKVKDEDDVKIKPKKKEVGQETKEEKKERKKFSGSYIAAMQRQRPQMYLLPTPGNPMGLLMYGMRPPSLPLPRPVGGPGYMHAPNMPQMVGPPGAPSFPSQT